MKQYWVVYGYNEKAGVWDEIDFNTRYRNIRYVFRNGVRGKSLRAHGFNKFVVVRRNRSQIWAFMAKPIPYQQFFTSARVDVFLRRLSKYAPPITHS